MKSVSHCLSAGSLLLTLLLLLPLLSPGEAPVLSDKELSRPPAYIMRTCCAFGADLSIARLPFASRTDIMSPADLGDHVYGGNQGEGNGIIYTSRGGFIDIGHLRDYADWTGYMFRLLSEYNDRQEPLVLELGHEGGQKTLQVDFPAKLTRDELINLAGAIAYDLSVWHEIATWFGASYIPFIPERYSSFSPEDIYSNLLGVRLGMDAIRSAKPFDQAMTASMQMLMGELGAMSTAEETLNAMISVDNLWWTSTRSLPSEKVLLKRYLQISPTLTPWLIPEQINPNPIVQKVPVTKTDYSFQIKINHKFPRRQLEQIIEQKVITQKDFTWLIEFIELDIIDTAVRQGQKEQKVSDRQRKRQAPKIRAWNIADSR